MEALLSVVQRDEEVQRRQFRRMVEAEQDRAEQAAAYEVEIGTLRQEAIALRADIRRLKRCTGGDMQDLFEGYEAQVSRLRGEAERQRERAAQAELQLCDAEFALQAS